MKVIINIDGGSRGNPGPGASGYVIKDTNGKILKQEGVFLGTCTNNEAEFKAILFAFEAALSLGATELQIYADSQLLVRQYSGEYKVKSPNLMPIMKEIRMKAIKFDNVRLSHVPREQNKEADKLANIAMDKATKPAQAKLMAAAAQMKAEAENYYKPRKEPAIVNHLSAPVKISRVPEQKEEKKVKPKPQKTARKPEKKKEPDMPEQLELF
ncbi:ribonuclease HI [Elusimicrobium posterum]|uniref:ribonuclease HI family protein n=1 Tax=Elusimicrobium posterum TaxID=3116653 RepID=UPI003C7930EB